jgi:homoserine O-acetyltransferase/O-succinyltransferase
MKEIIKQRTVNIFKSKEEFLFENGKSIAELEIAYETYGELNPDKSNAIIVCHALTGSAHVTGEASYPSFMIKHTPLLKSINGNTPGWWQELIGRGKVFDTEKYFIICSNVIGSCYGSSGPLSINPQTGKIFGPDFPQVTVRDMVNAQSRLLDYLEIDKLLLATGGSLGGMQVLEWALSFPQKVHAIIPIATSVRHSDWSIGLNHIARQAILNDPEFKNGYYSKQPEKGLSLARKVGMISYRTDRNFNGRFNYERRENQKDIFNSDNIFQVESYLNYQGLKLVGRFDANTFLNLSKAMDLHDVSRDRGSLEDVLGSIKQPTLCIGIDSDILYPAHEQKAISANIPNAEYAEIDSVYGHDAFLIEFEKMDKIITPFLERIKSIKN